MSDQEFDDIPFFSDDQAVFQEREMLYALRRGDFARFMLMAASLLNADDLPEEGKK